MGLVSIILSICFSSLVVHSQTLPNLLEPIDFAWPDDTSAYQQSCDLLLGEGPDSFWNSVSKDPSVCAEWETPVLSYMSRELTKVNSHLSYIRLIIDENVKFSALFKKVEKDSMLTSELLEILTPMAHFNKIEEESFGWLYEGTWNIRDNSDLSMREISSLILKVASCSPKKRETLEPIFMGLCKKIEEANNSQTLGINLSVLIESYGNTLAEDMVPKWKGLICNEEVGKSCPPIEKGTFDFFQNHVERFKSGGTCTSELYDRELNQLCEAMKVFGLNSLACEEYAQSGPILFESPCN